MSTPRYSLIHDNGVASITVYADGKVLAATEGHPNFDTIVKRVTSGKWLDDDASLFDVAETISKRFEHLSDRVTVKAGKIYFDGDPADDSLTRQILRFMEEKADFAPLVRFMEKIAMNPQEHSREQLFTWLQNNNFTIDNEGDIIAYKGVNVNSDNVYVSTHRGPAIVNGEEVNGYVPQPDGAVIEMPRSQVVHDPHNACSRGLHLSGWAYAQSYGTVRLQVKVNPRDIVSVPTHDGFQKVRCCRYTVIGKVTKPVTTAYLRKAAPKPVTAPVATAPVKKAVKAVKAAKPATVGYSELTLRGLRDAAQKRQIRVQGRRPSHCSKAELVKALKADDRKIARRATSKKK